MAEKNIQMQRKRSDGGFDTYYPQTKASQVKFEDGTTVEAHKADYMPHVTADGGFRYGFNVTTAGDLQFVYEEVVE